MLKLSTPFGTAEAGFKDVLFIGECTHAFTVAVGRLCGFIPHAGETECPHVKWVSGKLRSHFVIIELSCLPKIWQIEINI